MSTKTVEFAALGVTYRTRTFTAVRGLEIFSSEGEMHPRDVLTQTEAFGDDGRWHALTDDDVINTHVKDGLGFVPPLMALKGLVKVIHDKNFGFMRDWKGIKVPRKFTSGAQTVNSKYSDPLISQLIQDGMATMKELEEYYSFEDAFKMFDIAVAKGLNEALANEAIKNKSR